MMKKEFPGGWMKFYTGVRSNFMILKPILEARFENLRTSVFQTNEDLGAAAAIEASDIIRHSIQDKGEATIIIATGNSQLTFLKALKTVPVEWSKVNIFHMDEYIDLAPAHPARFSSFLQRHFLSSIQPKAFFPVPLGSLQNAEAGCRYYEGMLASHPADLCVLGIGENGHIAFNDPLYADFNDPRRVKVVELDEASRRQQVGEGHFTTIDEVPTHAITLTVPALLAAKYILALVPEGRKSEAVYRSLTGLVSETCPASILREIDYAHLYLDSASAQKIWPIIRMKG
jgi:glucosamine-6-phosphate deaminase